MRRSYVFRLRPTSRQHVALGQCLDAHRELYNAALQERRDAWSHSKTRIYYGDQSAQLTEIRAACPDQSVWSFSSQQATLRRLNKAFDGFFRRAKTAQPGVKAGYPRFKGKARFDSVEWPKDGDGARWLPEHKRVYKPGQSRRTLSQGRFHGISTGRSSSGCLKVSSNASGMAEMLLVWTAGSARAVGPVKWTITR